MIKKKKRSDTRIDLCVWVHLDRSQLAQDALFRFPSVSGLVTGFRSSMKSSCPLPTEFKPFLLSFKVKTRNLEMAARQPMGNSLPGSSLEELCGSSPLGHVGHSEHQSNWSPPSPRSPQIHPAFPTVTVYEGGACQGHSTVEDPVHHHSLDNNAHVKTSRKENTSQVAWKTLGPHGTADDAECPVLLNPPWYWLPAWELLLQHPPPHYYCVQEASWLKSVLLHKVALFVTT